MSSGAIATGRPIGPGSPPTSRSPLSNTPLPADLHPSHPTDTSDASTLTTANNLQRTRRYAGSVLPFGIGSAITLKYGLDEIHEGARKNGAVDVVRGAAGILDNANLLVYLSAVIPIAGPVLQVAGAIGAVSSIAAAPLDGGRDVIEGLHDHQGKTAAIGGVKLFAAGLSIAGSLTANPILLAAGTVVGLSALAYQNRAALAHIAHKVKDKLTHHNDAPAALPHIVSADTTAGAA